MKITWLHYLVIGLVAVIIAMILFWPKPQPSEREIKLAQANETLKAQVAESDKVGKEIVTKMAKDNLEDLKALKRFEIENKRLRVKIANIKPRVDSILIRFPVADTLFRSQDSLIQVQAHRIDSLTLEKLVMQKSFSALVMQKDTEIQSLLEINRNMDKIVDLKNKENRRARRGNKLWKAAAITLGVSGVLVGSQL